MKKTVIESTTTSAAEVAAEFVGFWRAGGVGLSREAAIARFGESEPPEEEDINSKGATTVNSSRRFEQ